MECNVWECPHACEVVYYESIKREPKIRGIKKCRCDERLQTKTKEFTRRPYTGLVLELEHLCFEKAKKKEFPSLHMMTCGNGDMTIEPTEMTVFKVFQTASVEGI
jgi:hypothetical protein